MRGLAQQAWPYTCTIYVARKTRRATRTTRPGRWRDRLAGAALLPTYSLATITMLFRAAACATSIHETFLATGKSVLPFFPLHWCA